MLESHRAKRGAEINRMRPRPKAIKKLEAGQKVRDVRDNNEGVVLDFACQYAYPKAAPVYSYLIRWKDGQVQAVSEAAFQGGFGLELTD
jgi:hypothetical protein